MSGPPVVNGRWDSAYHAPVLAAEILDLFGGARTALDCTLGGGGHTLAMLEAGIERVPRTAGVQEGYPVGGKWQIVQEGVDAGGLPVAAKAPVYVDGEHFTTLKGDFIAEEFQRILEEYVESHYPSKTAEDRYPLSAIR